VLDVLPVLSWQVRLAELCGSMALTALFAGIAALIWAVPGQMRHLTDLSTFFFLTVGVCWAVLVPAKLWAGRRGDSWLRRLILLLVGVGVGFGAMWLEGWLPRLPPGESSPLASASPVFSSVFPTGGIADVAAYLSYFGLVFFALRWWKMADPRRSQRFSFAPILTAGFWSLILLLVWPQPIHGAAALIVASVIVQLVSPWEPPPRAAAKPARLRYA
jgi:hypothetical protein